MSLPEWIKSLLSSSAWTRVEDEKLLKALSIAWEALENVKAHTEKPFSEVKLWPKENNEVIKEAMRRIEEMGK